MSREKIEQAGFTPEQATLLTDLFRDKDARIEELRHLLDGLLAPLLRDEIRAWLAPRGGFKRARDPITFDLICLDMADPATLTRRDLFLDQKTLDQHYEDSFASMGSVPANKALRFVNQVAVALSERIGARLAGAGGLPRELLTEALFHPIIAEAARLIPARHMARRIARLAAGETVLIPLTGTRFTYHELEPFYLAAELQRRGAAVSFISTDETVARRARDEGSVSLSIAPEPALWSLPPVSDAPDRGPPRAEGRAAIAGAGIRGFSYILRKLDDPIKFQSPLPHIMDRSIGEPHYAVLDSAHLPVLFNLPFRRVSGNGHLGRAGTLLACTLPHGDMGDFLFNALGGVVAGALNHMRALVRREGITEAHICEHPFFETAILAHAVRENGGRVTLWPHGWGVSWWGLPRHRGSAQAAYSVDQDGAAIWRQRLPDAEVRVVSDLYLPRYRAPRPVVRDEPLNVVIIGNCYNSARVPMLRKHSLETISRGLYQAFADLPDDVRWTYRPRGTEDLQWQWELAGRPADFRYTTVPPAIIDLPNMVFLFPGLLSSALIEGINRGIPALIAREDDTIEDYLGSEVGDCVPRGGVELVVSEIIRCRDPDYRQALVERQVAWCEDTQLKWESE